MMYIPTNDTAQYNTSTGYTYGANTGISVQTTPPGSTNQTVIPSPYTPPVLPPPVYPPAPLPATFPSSPFPAPSLYPPAPLYTPPLLPVTVPWYQNTTYLIGIAVVGIGAAYLLMKK
jgi:hypothetical protein